MTFAKKARNLARSAHDPCLLLPFLTALTVVGQAEENLQPRLSSLDRLDPHKLTRAELASTSCSIKLRDPHLASLMTETSQLAFLEGLLDSLSFHLR